MPTVREQFIALIETRPWDLFRVCVVVVQVPSGALETIVNYVGVSDKIKYYREAYDEEFRLKTNSVIQIVGFLLV